MDSYQGFFQNIMLLLEALWSKAHGWERLTHIHSFGWWFAKAVHFGCPAIGFIVFWLVSRQRIGRNGWKPLTIVIVFTALTRLLLAHNPANSALWLPWMEAASAVFVFVLMIGSVGALPAIRPRWRLRETNPAVSA